MHTLRTSDHSGTTLRSPGLGSRWRSRGLTLVVVGGVLVGTLAGCSLTKKAPEPTGAAQALADGLASANLSKVTLDGATPTDATTFVTTAIGDLKDTRRTVTVASVVKDAANDKAATATLTTTWDLDGGSPASGAATTGSATTGSLSTGTATTTGTPGTGASGTTTAATGRAAGPAAPTWTYSTTAKMSLNADDTWHVTWSPTIFVPDLTPTDKIDLSHTQATRADILGPGTVQLMAERATFQIGIDKGRITAAQAGSSATALAAVIGIDGAAFAKSVAAAGAKAFVVGLTVRATDPVATTKSAAISAVPGGVSIPGKAVLGPTTTFARSLLGTVGEATAEVIAKSNGAIRPGDRVGLSGLEQRYDTQLRGASGLTVAAVGTDAAGKTTSRPLFSRDPVAGKPLTLTLDVGAQLAAESALAAQTTTPTALVAIRPSTGEIVAAANGPATNGQAVATTGHAAPGSTFKIVSALALLRAGLTPDSPVACTPTVTVDGRVFKNYDDYPSDKLGPAIPFRTAFANSCNTAFISNNGKIQQADLTSAAAALGIGVDLDLGFPAYLGSVPDQGAGTEHAASMIGQAKIEVAPMDMATVVASVVKGSLVRPSLVVDNPAVAAFPTPAKPLTPAEAQSLRQLMGAVVTEGSGRVLASSGVTLAKTGTAEYGTQTPPKTHAWMVAARGDLAVAAYVEDGVSGSQSAAPLIADFLAQYAG
ncbi:MAG: penicillin-binding transpeptidase domain-containing protein [Lapillicoccus sp.]